MLAGCAAGLRPRPGEEVPQVQLRKGIDEPNAGVLLESVAFAALDLAEGGAIDFGEFGYPVTREPTPVAHLTDRV